MAANSHAADWEKNDSLIIHLTACWTFFLTGHSSLNQEQGGKCTTDANLLNTFISNLYQGYTSDYVFSPSAAVVHFGACPP